MIHLTNTKETFIKNLIKIGYNYKIKQYDDFIGTIRRIISSQITTATQERNLKETIELIFGYDVPLLIIEDVSKIEKIKISFLKKLIDDGLLDLYLLENNRIVSKEIQENAYLKTLLNKLDQNSYYISYTMKEKYKKILDARSSQYLSIKKCIDHNQIFISDENKHEIEKSLKIEISENLIQGENHKLDNIISNIHFTFLGKYFIEKAQLKNMIMSELLNTNLLSDRIQSFNLQNNLSLKCKHIDSLLMKLNKKTGLSKVNILRILRAIKEEDTSLLKNMKIFKDQRVEKNIWNTLKKQGIKVYDGFSEFKSQIDEYEFPYTNTVAIRFTYGDKIIDLNPLDYLIETDNN